MEKEKPKKKKHVEKEIIDESTIDETIQEEDNGITFTKVDKLMDLGINKSDIDKLREAGFNSIEALFMSTKKHICEIKGISENKFDKIQKAVQQILGKRMDISISRNFLEKRKMLTYLTTGSSQLDLLLNGGVETCNLTELFGEFRTGKTQLCHTLCVTCQLAKKDGGGFGKAMYIDTEGTFRPERLIPIAKRFNLDPDEVIDRVYYARAYNHEHQSKLLVQAAALMATEKFALLIIDSATALYRTDYCGRGELNARQIHLGKFLRACQKIADEFGVAVVVTNQVVATVDGGGYGGNDKKPIGGHIMAHATQTRLYLRKGAKENRICRVYDSPTLPEAEASYSINEDGIRDSTN